jgi:hypothetical protein
MAAELVPTRAATSTIRAPARPRSAITSAAAASNCGLRIWSICGRGLTVRSSSSLPGLGPNPELGSENYC